MTHLRPSLLRRLEAEYVVACRNAERKYTPTPEQIAEVRQRAADYMERRQQFSRDRRFIALMEERRAHRQSERRERE